MADEVMNKRLVVIDEVEYNLEEKDAALIKAIQDLTRKINRLTNRPY